MDDRDRLALYPVVASVSHAAEAPKDEGPREATKADYSTVGRVDL
jgi:hypothetical protein